MLQSIKMLNLLIRETIIKKKKKIVKTQGPQIILIDKPIMKTNRKLLLFLAVQIHEIRKMPLLGRIISDNPPFGIIP